MAESGKLYVIITDERKGGGGETPTPQPGSGSGDGKDDSSALGRYAEHQLFHLVKSQMTQAVNFATSNIGDLTGDYIAQRKVNVAKQAISGVMQIGQATLGGAAAGGWVGAIIGFAVGTVSLVTSSAYSEAENRRSNALANQEIAQLRERAGLNASKDGSRGTED